MIQSVNTLEALLEKNDTELRAIITNNNNVRDEELRRLVRAINNLRRCRASIRAGDKEPTDLFWDSWDRHPIHRSSGASPRPIRAPGGKHHQRVSNGMIQSPIEISPPDNIPTITNILPHAISPEDTSVSTLTPSPSPPNSPSNLLLTNNKQNNKSGRGFPTTPPPRRKHQTLIPSNNIGQQQQQPNQQQQQQQQNTNNNNNNINNTVTPSSSGDPFASLTKSKSHESQLLANQELANQNNNVNTNHVTTNTTQPATIVTSPPTTSVSGRSRLHTEPGPQNHHQYHHHYQQQHSQHQHSQHQQQQNEVNNDNINASGQQTTNLSVPRSPCTPIINRGMGHMIAHRFTKKFKMTSSTCDLCNKQMFFGYKCTECKYRCHKDCKNNVPPSCGLPQELVDVFKKTLQSPNMIHCGQTLLPGTRRDRQKSQFHGPDSSSAGSSCNSSSPSSPALLQLPPQTPATSKHFNFPEISSHSSTSSLANHSNNNYNNHYNNNSNNTHHNNNNTIDSIKSGSSGGSDHYTTNSMSSQSTLVSMGGYIGSNGNGSLSHHHHHLQQNIPTFQLSELSDTHQSNDSDKTGSTSASTDSGHTPQRLDSTEERDSGHWPRQNSLSLKEWDIPYDDLKLLEKIGKGRFGTVHRALWHGDVAVKLLNEDYLADESTLEAFKLEVAIFKKTRHENVVLFMGACMKPPRLAIVTSLCKGNTLFTHIHLRKDKFNLNRTTLVAQQISTGMGYLHARGIVHKDLKTKNIFLENGKVIITDFGLFSATKLWYCELGLGIPYGWLCYLSPELIRRLKPYRDDEDLPFTPHSDIYAFGTVWYELLCGEFPFKSQPPESIIWQVGYGMKQPLANLQASRDVKDILMHCWSFQADDRKDFPNLQILLERLPKKRLARSPSHPVQLSRSAESVF